MAYYYHLIHWRFAQYARIGNCYLPVVSSSAILALYLSIDVKEVELVAIWSKFVSFHTYLDDIVEATATSHFVSVLVCAMDHLVSGCAHE